MTRRGWLAILGGSVPAIGAGCTDGDETGTAVPRPIPLNGGKQDDQGGMIIGDHFGPNAQIFYRDNGPKGHDNPAWFHTLSMGLFPYYFDHRRRGWTADVIYATDYSRVEYDLAKEAGDTYITSHTDADTFADVRTLTFVADSEILGGMGKELIPFSNVEDATTFENYYGGTRLEFEDITEEWLTEYLHR